MKRSCAVAVATALALISLPGQVTCRRTDYLYYSSGGHQGSGPGLYVSDVNWYDGLAGATRLTGTRRFGAECSDLGRSDHWIQSLSYDSRRGRILVMSSQSQYDDDPGFSLTLAPACFECTDNGTNIKQFFVNAHISPQQFKMRGVAIKGHRIFFVGERKLTIDTHLTQHDVELRRLTLGGRCGHLYPVRSADPFNIDDCSRLIAVVSNETYNNRPVYQPFESLLAAANGDFSTIDIYLQLQEITYDASGSRANEIAAELYHVRYRPTTADDDADRETAVFTAHENVEYRQTSQSQPAAKAVPIHKTVLPHESIHYTLTNRGGMSAKVSSVDNHMCWSVFDRVLCGDRTSSGRVTDVATILPPDVVARNVCAGNNVLENVITGVAHRYWEEKHDFWFYFGCVARTTGMGGAGLFNGRVNDLSATKVYPLRVDDGEDEDQLMQAGSMFLADGSLCDPEIWELVTGTGACLSSYYWSATSTVTGISVLLVSSIQHR